MRHRFTISQSRVKARIAELMIIMNDAEQEGHRGVIRRLKRILNDVVLTADQFKAVTEEIKIRKKLILELRWAREAWHHQEKFHGARVREAAPKLVVSNPPAVEAVQANWG